MSRTAIATESPPSGTAIGQRQALFLTRTRHRLLCDGMAELTEPVPANPRRIRAAGRAYDTAIDDLLTRAGLAA